MDEHKKSMELKAGKFYMTGVLNYKKATIERLSDGADDQHYFYGYYDNPALTQDDKWHLCNRVSFMNRLQRADDENELGYIDMETKKFHPFATTNAWNFQQGTMLQWLSSQKKEAVYNSWTGSGYEAVVQNVITRETRRLSAPVANVSPDGKWGIALNFNRIYDFRPGYGYCNRKDPWYHVAAPADDGISLVDMETGEAKQIVSYEAMERIFADEPKYKNRKIVVNHATFNPASNRFLFLVRYFPEEGGEWGTALGTCDLQGNVYKLRGYTYASHYFWKNASTILIYADGGEGPGLYELTDLTQDYKLYDKSFFNQDIHCSYSPDGQFILGDGYADEEEYRPLFLYHIPSGKGTLLARFYSPALADFDIRSDLHCRWMHSGTAITFDSIHEGFRGLYKMDLQDAMTSLRDGAESDTTNVTQNTKQKGETT